MSLRRMCRKREWKMSLRDPVFAQFSVPALNFHSKIYDNLTKYYLFHFLIHKQFRLCYV